MCIIRTYLWLGVKERHLPGENGGVEQLCTSPGHLDILGMEDGAPQYPWDHENAWERVRHVLENATDEGMQRDIPVLVNILERVSSLPPEKVGHRRPRRGIDTAMYSAR